MQNHQLPSCQKLAQDMIGNVLTTLLSEKGHAAIVRLAAASVYMEADTNIAYKEIEAAIKAANWRGMIAEVVAPYGKLGKKFGEMMHAAVEIEKRNQLRYWKEFDSVIHETANLPAAAPEHMTAIATVYAEPEYDTEANAALIMTIQMYCPEMAPDRKRAFARLIQKTMDNQRKMLGV